jgi:mRNA-degrading endonuclease toxin of MazEF toxin-antitoxin module
VARRGDVLRLRRGIGFGPRDQVHRFVVVQDERYLDVFETVLVVPLVTATAAHVGSSFAVPVTAAEAGAEVAQVALTPRIGGIPLESFEPGNVGQLDDVTIDEVTSMLCALLCAPTP